MNVNVELLSELELTKKDNERLKKQLDYLRNGEYLNQLIFERNMLQNVVAEMKVSNEDREFIDMTHRNTELLKENKKYKETIDKAIDKLYCWGEVLNAEFQKQMLDILKEVE